MSTPNGLPGRTGDGNHHLHDIDLVAAYALSSDLEGDDPGIDRDQAVALVQTCPECAAEFNLQREVATWMSEAPVVVMGDDERSLLHARVSQEVSRPNVVSLSDRRSRRQPGLMLFRLGTAAAALAVIAGIGGVFNIGGDNDGGTAFQTVASEMDEGAESTPDAPDNQLAPTTTMAAFAAAAAERAMLPGGDIATVNKEIEDLIIQATVTREASGAAENSQDSALVPPPACSDQVEDRNVVLSAESSLDGEPIVIFLVTSTESSADSALEALVFRIVGCPPVDLG